MGPGPELSSAQGKCHVVSRVGLKSTQAHPGHLLGDEYKSQWLHLTEMRVYEHRKGQEDTIFLDMVLLYIMQMEGNYRGEGDCR